MEVLSVRSVNVLTMCRKSNSKNYWIDYYINGKRTRERIGRSKQAAENRLREIQTAKAEGRHIKKNKNSLVTLGSLRDWYLNLDEVKELSSYPRLQVLTCSHSSFVGQEYYSKCFETWKGKRI